MSLFLFSQKLARRESNELDNNAPARQPRRLSRDVSSSLSELSRLKHPTALVVRGETLRPTQSVIPTLGLITCRPSVSFTWAWACSFKLNLFLLHKNTSPDIDCVVGFNEIQEFLSLLFWSLVRKRTQEVSLVKSSPCRCLWANLWYLFTSSSPASAFLDPKVC